MKRIRSKDFESGFILLRACTHRYTILSIISSALVLFMKFANRVALVWNYNDSPMLFAGGK